MSFHTSKLSVRDCFKLFQLNPPPRSTASDFKLAYRELSKKWHPDKNNSSQESHEMFLKINTAYETLKKFFESGAKLDSIADNGGSFFKRTDVNTADFYWINQRQERKHVKDLETTHLASLKTYLESNGRTTEAIYSNICSELSTRTVKVTGKTFTVRF